MMNTSFQRFATNLKRGIRLVRLVNYDPRAKLGPLLIELTITSACNYRCYFCGAHSHLAGFTKSGTLTDSDLEGLARSIRELRVPEVRLAGDGEPLLAERTDRFIETYGDRLGLTLLSNGSTLDRVTDPMLAKLAKLVISLNSMNPGTHRLIHGHNDEGQLSHILSNIERLLDSPGGRAKIQINCVLTTDNYGELTDLISLSRDWRVPVLINPVVTYFEECKDRELTPRAKQETLDMVGSALRKARGSNQPSYLHTLRYLRRSVLSAIERDRETKVLRPCYAGFYGGFVDSNGDYRICCHCEKPIGNVRKKSFREIWQSTAAQRLRYSAMLMPLTGSPVCDRCYTCTEVHLYSAAFHRAFTRIPGQAGLAGRRARKVAGRS